MGLVVKSASRGDGPVRIGKSLVNSLAAASRTERLILWDATCKGFGLRAYPTGRIAYVLQYRMKGAGSPTRTVTIGTHGSPWTPDAARERARALLELVRTGIDPAAQEAADADEERERVAREAAQAEAARRYDFDAFLDRYIVSHVKREVLRSLADIEGTFDRDVRPAFRGRSVLDITKQDVKDLRAKIGERSHSAANKAHKWLHAAFMWGVDQDGLVTHPMIGLKKPFGEPKRTRFLSDAEIALLWSVVDDTDWRFADIERLLILTGQRLREVAGMRWSEIDLEKAEWIIPASRTKNKRAHLVPLSPQALRIIEEVARRSGSRRGLLFTTTGKTPVSGFSRSKAKLDELIETALAKEEWTALEGFEEWVRHDHRRGVSTGMGQLGVPLVVCEAVLNHASGELGGIAGTYYLYKHAPEKRDALCRWADRIETALSRHGVAFIPDPSAG